MWGVAGHRGGWYKGGYESPQGHTLDTRYYCVNKSSHFVVFDS